MHAILQIALNTSVFAMALENTVNISILGCSMDKTS